MGMATTKRNPDARLPRSFLKACVAVCLVVSVSACSWNEERTKTLGGVVGGVMGGLLGSKFGSGAGRTVAIAVGATLGAMLGQDIAAGMTDVDKAFFERTTEDTLEYGEPGEQATWSNPDSGNSGAVTAGEAYQNDDGNDCRSFETAVQVDGEDRTGQGTACRMDDGSWKVVEEPV